MNVLEAPLFLSLTHVVNRLRKTTALPKPRLQHNIKEITFNSLRKLAWDQPWKLLYSGTTPNCDEAAPEDSPTVTL